MVPAQDAHAHPVGRDDILLKAPFSLTTDAVKAPLVPGANDVVPLQCALASPCQGARQRDCTRRGWRRTRRLGTSGQYVPRPPSPAAPVVGKGPRQRPRQPNRCRRFFPWWMKQITNAGPCQAERGEREVLLGGTNACSDASFRPACCAYATLNCPIRGFRAGRFGPKLAGSQHHPRPDRPHERKLDHGYACARRQAQRNDPRR